MKQTTRHTIRRWTGLMLAMCILGLMLPAGALADEPFYGVYTGGVVDRSHDADHDPLGDLVYSEYSSLQGRGYNYGALFLEFPDEEGGGDVSIKAGSITAETDHMDEFISYDDPKDPSAGYTETHSVCGVTISMRDDSTVNLETGKIDAVGTAVGIDMEDRSKLTMNVTDTISGAAGISITTYSDSDADINTKDIVTQTTGLYIKGNDLDDINVRIDGSIDAGKGQDKAGHGISIQIDDDSKVDIQVEGDVKTGGVGGGGEGIQLTNGIYTPEFYNYDGSVDPEQYSNGYVNIYIKGDVESGGTAAHLQNNAGDVTVIVGERDADGKIISGGDVTCNGGSGDPYEIYNEGVFIKTDKKSTTIFSAADVYSEEGKGIVAESEGTESTVKVSVGDVQSWGDNGIYAAAWGEGSYTTLKAGDVFGRTIGVVLDANDSSYDANGEINAELGNVQGFEGGLYANSTDGKITVSAKNIDARDYNGVDVSMFGQNEGNGVTAAIDGNIQAGTNGVQVSTYANTRYLEDEYGQYIEDDDGYYLTVTEIPNSYADITVTGAIDADENGIKTHNEGGDFSVSVTKGISVSTVKDGNPDYDVTITGVKADATNGKTTITVDGGVSVFFSEPTERPQAAAPEGGYEEDDDGDNDDRGYEAGSEYSFQGNGVVVSNKSGEVDININGDVSAKDGTAVCMGLPYYMMYGSDENQTTGTTALKIKGNVTAENGMDIVNLDNETAIEITGNVKASAEGAKVENKTGTAAIKIGGNMTAEESGVAIGNEDGTVTMDIAGDVTAGTGYAATVINVGEEGGTSSLSIGGNLTAGKNGLGIIHYSGEMNVDIAGDLDAADGIGITITGQGPGWENNGTAVVSIGGSLIAKNGIDVNFNGEGDGSAQIIVGGDLIGVDSGVKLGVYEAPMCASGITDAAGGERANEAENTDPAVDIVVEETISGELPIFVESAQAAANFLITTWAVIPNENKQITVDRYGDSVESVEKSINYIIKKEDNAKYGTLNVDGTSEKTVSTAGADGSGAEAAGGDGQGTHTLNVAKEKKELTLSVDLKEEFRKGYEVVIYNGKGDAKRKADVEKKEDGSFIFMVPWAGGVYLTFDLEKLSTTDEDSEPDTEPEPNPDPDPDPDAEPDPEPATEPEKEPEKEPDPEPAADPVKDPQNGPEPEEKKEPASDPEPKTEDETDDDTETETDTDTDGEGRVVAILYGEDEAYTIWFLTGYAYKAEFKDGYTETGSYSVEGSILTLTAEGGSKRTPDSEWNMAFSDELTAAIVKADFSDSVKVIGEFNLNAEGTLEITDEKNEELDLSVIRSTIDNPQAFDILKAILPEEAK